MASIDYAFKWARIHAVRHMASCENAGLRWGETAITEIVTSRAAAAVTVVPFTQRAEATSGADWIWWWVDTIAAYGMLVQAKRMRLSSGTWALDFSYPRGTGRQRTTLMATAASLDLTPVYAIYLGSAEYRGWEPCDQDHRAGRCLGCVKRSVSIMPALLADEYVVDSASTYERSIALEDLWAPTSYLGRLIPSLRMQLDPGLARFLTREQHGVRAVTRSMIDRVLNTRAQQFAATTPSTVSEPVNGRHDDLGSVFRDLPGDTGHWDVPYFQQLLDPLRHVPPWYVLAIQSGDFDAEGIAIDLPESVAGIMVARLPEDSSQLDVL